MVIEKITVVQTVPFQLRRILVPVDFSPASYSAVEYAGFLAHEYGAAIDIIHVCPRGSLRHSAHGPFEQATVNHAAEQMRNLLLALEQSGIETARGRFGDGPTAGVIIEAAAREDYDLVVVGAHCHSLLHRFFTGSIAGKILRRVRCPVLTVHSENHIEGESSQNSADDLC